MPRNAHDKQLAILSFINQQVDLHGYPPRFVRFVMRLTFHQPQPSMDILNA